MPIDSGYKLVRTIGTTSSAESAPSASSAWFSPDRFPNANGLEIAFGTVTKGNADNKATVQLYLKQTISGTATILPYDTSAGSIASGSTAVSKKQYTNMPPGDIFPIVTGIAGTTSHVAFSVYARPIITQQ